MKRPFQIQMPRLRYLVSLGWRLTELAAKYNCDRRMVHQRIQTLDILYNYSKGSPGSRNGSWKGGRSKRKGYWYILRPNHPNATKGGYVLESRLVMEKKLGRLLSRSEVVHHKDSNLDNNKLSNLFVYGSNGEHLAETLKGQCPNWTEDGKRRIQEGVHRAVVKRKKKAIQHQLRSGAARLPR